MSKQEDADTPDVCDSNLSTKKVRFINEDNISAAVNIKCHEKKGTTQTVLHSPSARAFWKVVVNHGAIENPSTPRMDLPFHWLILWVRTESDKP